MLIFERFIFAIVLGLLAAAGFAAIDLFTHAGHVEPVDVLFALEFAAPSAVLAAIAIVTVHSIAFWAAGRNPSRWQWIAALAGLVLVAFELATVIMGTYKFRNWFGVAVLAALIPSTGLLFPVARYMQHTVAVRRPIYAASVALLAVLLACVAHTSATAWNPPPATPWLAAIAALLMGLIAVHGRRVPVRRVAGVASVASVVLATVVSVRPPPTSAQASTSGASTDDPPNVVLIVLDTTRRDHLGCYGGTAELTPTIDALARESVVYEQAFSTAPWTIPSHASLFTGLPPRTHGCSNEHRLWLDDRFVTMAELLSAAGYQSAAFNSNVALEPTNILRGFDRVVPLYGSHSVDRMTLADAARARGVPERWVDQGAGEALLAIDQWLAHECDARKPAFVFVNLLEPHHPYLPPLPERGAYLPEGTTLRAATAFGRSLYPLALHFQQSTDAYKMRLARALYAAEVRYLDRRLGDLLSLLRAHLDFNNTLLIITADHGENLGEGGRWDHQFALNDALIHVPLIVRYPGNADAGTRVAGLCQSTDVLPTVLSVAGLANPEAPLSGRALFPRSFRPLEAIVAQVDPYYMRINMIQQDLGFRVDVHPFLASLRTIHDGHFKYVAYSDGRQRLYDVTRDASETRDLSQALPERTARMAAQLEDMLTSIDAYDSADVETGGGAPLSAEEIEQLRALGYVE